MCKQRDASHRQCECGYYLTVFGRQHVFDQFNLCSSIPFFASRLCLSWKFLFWEKYKIGRTVVHCSLGIGDQCFFYELFRSTRLSLLFTCALPFKYDDFYHYILRWSSPSTFYGTARGQIHTIIRRGTCLICTSFPSIH